MDREPVPETGGSTASPPSGFINLQKAIELGEYEPRILSQFEEWHKLSRHAQFQLIRQGLDNRERHLKMQWAEVNNVLDFSQKPELQQVLRNLEMQIHQVWDDRERLYQEVY